MAKRKEQTISVRVSESLHGELVTRSLKTGISIRYLIDEAIRLLINKPSPTPATQSEDIQK